MDDFWGNEKAFINPNEQSEASKPCLSQGDKIDIASAAGNFVIKGNSKLSPRSQGRQDLLEETKADEDESYDDVTNNLDI